MLFSRDPPQSFNGLVEKQEISSLLNDWKHVRKSPSVTVCQFLKNRSNFRQGASRFHKLGLIVSIYTELFVLTAMCLGKEKKKNLYPAISSISAGCYMSLIPLKAWSSLNLMSARQEPLGQAATLCPPCRLSPPSASGTRRAAHTASGREDQLKPPQQLQPAWNNLTQVLL